MHQQQGSAALEEGSMASTGHCASACRYMSSAALQPIDGGQEVQYGDCCIDSWHASSRALRPQWQAATPVLAFPIKMAGA